MFFTTIVFRSNVKLNIKVGAETKVSGLFLSVWQSDMGLPLLHQGRLQYDDF